MPVADDPDRRGGGLLLDAAGTPLARFVRADRDARPLADLLELEDGVGIDDAAQAILAELRGWRVSARPELGETLLAAGGTLRRDAHVMSRDLVRDPPDAGWLEAPAPAGLRLAPADRPAADLVPAFRAAYPPEHPDFATGQRRERPEVELEEIVSGRAMGPLLRAGGLALDAESNVVAAILVCASPGEPPFGGPWIIQFFRAPGAPGAGRALLRRALAIGARDGLPALSLAVTHGNPAIGVYAAHGFTDVLRSLTVDL